MSGSDILTCKEPEQLFPGDDDAAQTLYRELAKKWHPDVKGGSVEVFARITELYRRRSEKLSAGTWSGSRTLILGTNTLNVLRGYTFPFGHASICDSSLWFVYNSDHTKWYEAALAVPPKFRYANDKMRSQFERSLPRVTRHGYLDDGRRFFGVEKTTEVVRLRDAVEYLGGFDVKHTLWVISSLMNLACYLSYTGLAHQNISMDTVFISPEHHSVALLGGWEYSALRGASITVVPSHTFAVMPFTAKITKKASSLTDLELIRLLGRTLGKYDKPAKPVMDFLTAVGNGSAIVQYRLWIKTLEAAYGPRRFTQLKLSAEDVYKRSWIGI
jgi:hypothetical protein